MEEIIARINRLWEEHLNSIKSQGRYFNTPYKKEVERELLKLSHIAGKEIAKAKIRELREKAQKICFSCSKRKECKNALS